MQNVTLVSACDQNYLWGAYLLVASVARNTPGLPVTIWQTGFGKEHVQLIEQFPNVIVKKLKNGDPRSVAVRKPEAILGVETEFAAWMDADCFIIGDISKYLIPSNGAFQIRFRGPEENANVWRNHYQTGDLPGGIPETVLARWRRDVAEREIPRFNTTCVTNCFVVHRDYMDWIQRWSRQLDKVLSGTVRRPVDFSVPEYFMTDESVLSSMQAFAESCPPNSHYMLDQDPSAHVAHFGSNSKPWQHWSKKSWYTRGYLLETIQWAKSQGYALPVVPRSLKSSSALTSYCLMWALELKAKMKEAVASRFRRYH